MEWSGAAPLEWSVATRARGGETASGDGYVVEAIRGGALLGVVDGLGHGVDAQTAAELALATMRDAAEESPEEIIKRCHLALTRTRGVVMTVASIVSGTLRWVGVGNVEGALFRAEARDRAVESAPLRGGVVGYQIPVLRPASVQLDAGDLCVLTTDGVSPGFWEKVGTSNPVREVASEILARFARGDDDALVLAARYLGGRP